jgi:hypothetical protein
LLTNKEKSKGDIFMKLASEKNLNRYSIPVYSIKGRPVSHPTKIEFGSTTFTCHQGELTPKHYMILDVLATMIMQFYYNRNEKSIDFNGKIPTSNDGRVKYASGFGMSHKFLKSLTNDFFANPDGIIANDYFEKVMHPRGIETAYGGIKIAESYSFIESALKKHFPILKPYNSAEIEDMIKSTSQCKVVMKYNVRYFDGKEYRNFPFINYSSPCSFFSILDISKHRVSINGNILERYYNICVNTHLGYLFMQNCFSSYIDLIPDKFYTMSDYAQLFYRLLILPFFGDSKLGLDYIRTRLFLKTKDNYMVKKMIRNMLEELEGNLFIKEPVELKQNDKYLYTFKKSSWKEINADQETSQPELVKTWGTSNSDNADTEA